MKFFHHNQSCSVINQLTNKNWNFLDNTQACEFSILARQFWQKYYPAQPHVDYSLDNFDKIPQVNRQLSNRLMQIDGIQKDLNNCCVYIDRGKSKTIVVVNSPNWYEQLYNDTGPEHKSSWFLEDSQFEDYNIISIVEDITRVYDNPVLYDSLYYCGINYNINSLPKLALYINKLINTKEYYVVGDCKNGHSSALLAYYLNASKVIISSGVSDIDFSFIQQKYMNEVGEYFLEAYWQIPFEIMLRTIAFGKHIPAELHSINSIAKKMPHAKFMYAHHENDTTFPEWIDMVDSNIVTKVSVKDSPYTFGNHYINIELYKAGHYLRFFNRN